ncbi:MAG: DUF3261 domain-containing protein [Holophaga sp.]|jgi:hypothetical protein
MAHCRPLLLSLSLPLLLAGCRRPATQVYVAPGVPFRLCPPEAGPELSVNQEVVFQLPDGRRETALAAIENHGGVLNLVASSPLGQTLVVIRVKGLDAAVDARIPIPGDLDPKVLAALVEFALWPEAALRASLGPGVRLEQDGDKRTLLRKDKVVWTVTREGTAPPFRRLVLENPAMGLTVRVRTLGD